MQLLNVELLTVIEEPPFTYKPAPYEATPLIKFEDVTLLVE